MIHNQQRSAGANLGEQFVYARVRKGAPMPHALTSFMTEDDFMAFRNDCERANTTAEFQTVVSRFNAGYGQPAVRGAEQRHSGFSLFLESVFTLGGFLGATSTGCDRTLVFDTYVLVRGRTSAAGSVPITVASASIAAPAPSAPAYTESGVPIAQPVV
jgi:hypothetical protein